MQEQAGHPVDEGQNVGTGGVVEVGTQQEHHVALQNGGKHLGGQSATIVAGAAAGIVQAGGVGAAPAVVNGSVLQADGLDFAEGGQVAADCLSHGHGVGAPVVRGVEHQHPGPGKPGRGELRQPPNQLPCPGEIRLLPGQVQLTGQDVLVVQGAGALHQGLAGKQTAGQIGSQGYGLGRLLGV